MKRANGGSLLGRVGRKSEMRRTSNAGARSVDIWPASALEFSFGTLLVILLAALNPPLNPRTRNTRNRFQPLHLTLESVFVKW